MIQELVNRLHKHPLLNLAIAFAYFVFIYFMHRPLVNLSVLIMNYLSLPIYNKVIAVFAFLFLLLLLVFMFSRLRKNTENRRRKILYLIVTATLIVVHFKTMFEMNIEIIHSLEFTFLAFLLYPLTGRYGAAIFFAIPFMLVDEWHQYRILYPTSVEFFEFNDIMMDMYGCAMTMLLLMVANISLPKKPVMVFRRVEFYTLIGVMMVAVLLVQFCYVALYAADSCDHTVLVLNTLREPQPFWRQFPGRDVIYHAMQPVEAFLVIPLMAFFYFGLDGYWGNRKQNISVS